MKECMKRKTCDKAFRCGDSVCRACKDRVEPGADADGDEPETDEEPEYANEETDGESKPFADIYGNSGSASVEVPVTIEKTVTVKYLLKIRVAADSEDEARERACATVDEMDADEVHENGEIISEEPDWDSADSDDDVKVVEGKLED